MADSESTHLDERARARADTLRRFFAIEACGRAPATVRRYARVARHLLRFLDVVDVEPLLGTGPAVQLERARAAGHDFPFFRLFDFDELVACLPAFLQDEWLMPHEVDERSQISLSGRLLTWARRERLIDMSLVACAYLEAEHAVRTARRSQRSRWEPGFETLPVGRSRLRLIQGGRRE